MRTNVKTPPDTVNRLVGLVAILVAVHAGWIVASSGQEEPINAPTVQVNQTVAGDQDRPAIDGNNRQGYIVVWQEPGIRARRYDRDGQPLGNEMELVPAADNPARPKVSLQEDGDFLLIWDEPSSGEGFEKSVRSQLFDSAGTALGNPLTLDESARSGDVERDATGAFMVAYFDEPTPDPEDFTSSVTGRFLSPEGIVQGESANLGFASGFEVAMSDSGRFVVGSYSLSYVFYNNKYTARLDRFSPSGTFEDGVFLGERAFLPTSVDAGPGEDFVVVWAETDLPDFIAAARYDGQLRQTVGFDKEFEYSDVAVDDGGNALLAGGRNTVAGELIAQHLSPSNEADPVIGSDANRARHVAVASAGTGRFMTVFRRDTSPGDDDSGTSIQAWSLIYDRLFSDGFEGGDPLAWGGTTGVPGCLPLAELSCIDNQVDGSNAGPGTTDVLESYPCLSAAAQGGDEIAYSFTPDVDGTYGLELTGLDANLSLSVIEGSTCDPALCISGSSEGNIQDESLTFDATAGTEYFVVVDGNPGAASPFQLTLTCP